MKLFSFALMFGFLYACAPSDNQLSEEAKKKPGLKLLKEREFDKVYRQNRLEGVYEDIKEADWDLSISELKSKQPRQLLLLVTSDGCENCVEMRDAMVAFRDQYSDPLRVLLREINIDDPSAPKKAMETNHLESRRDKIESEGAQLLVTFSGLKKYTFEDGEVWHPYEGMIRVQPVYNSVWIRTGLDGAENAESLKEMLLSADKEGDRFESSLPVAQYIDFVSFVGKGLNATHGEEEPVILQNEVNVAEYMRQFNAYRTMGRLDPLKSSRGLIIKAAENNPLQFEHGQGHHTNFGDFQIFQGEIAYYGWYPSTIEIALSGFYGSQAHKNIMMTGTHLCTGVHLITREQQGKKYYAWTQVFSGNKEFCDREK